MQAVEEFGPPRPRGRLWWAVLLIPIGLAVLAVLARYVHGPVHIRTDVSYRLVGAALSALVGEGLPFLAGRMSLQSTHGRAAAGWHEDPASIHEIRYWNGCTWTDHAADAGVVVVDPLDDTLGPVTEMTERRIVSHDARRVRYWWAFVTVPLLLQLGSAASSAIKPSHSSNPSVAVELFSILFLFAVLIAPSFYAGRLYAVRRGHPTTPIPGWDQGDVTRSGVAHTASTVVGRVELGSHAELLAPWLPDFESITRPARRACGFAIDYVVLVPVLLPAMLRLAGSGSFEIFLVFVAWLAMTIAYVTIATVRWGGTLGKLVTGTEVVDRRTGDRIGWRASTLRASTQMLLLAVLVWLLPNGLVVLIYGLAFSGVFRQPWREALDDKIARTVVLRRAPRHRWAEAGHALPHAATSSPDRS